MQVITEIINDNNYEFDFNYEEDFKNVAYHILEQEKCCEKMNICISLVDEETIMQLNNENRGINKITDVLSFPGIDFDKPANFSILDNKTVKIECFEPDTESFFLGDVVICVKRGQEQAAEFGHSIRREMCFLLAHSILHLLGYDHINDDERILMENKQDLYLNELDITRFN